MTFNTVADGRPLGRVGRSALVVWSLGLLAVFGVAAVLEPHSRGFGTHRALGLPPCSIRTVFDLPCPACGMTTSFCHFVRGRLLSAARSNSAGLLLAVFCALQVPWCLAGAVRGRLAWPSDPSRALAAALGAVWAVALGQWLIRLLS